jgi:thioesterase domain-containing protein
MAEIRGRLGVELPIETLVGEGTVAALARRVRSSAESVRSPLLVELQAGVEGAVPLFCIHPMGGGTMGYRDLAQALGPEQPVWGLRARGLMAGEEPLRRIEEMAELYLEAVRRQRPRGPYGLLGWSFGGMVAWEMARRLRDAGEEVPVLALVDLAARITPEMLSADELDLLVEGLRGMIPLTREELTEFAEEERLRLVVGKLRAAGAVGEDFGAVDVRRYLEVHRRCEEALLAYAPSGPYPGRVVVFRAAEQPQDRMVPEDMGWRQLVSGELVVHEVAGNHQTIVTTRHVTGRTSGQGWNLQSMGCRSR